MPLEIDPSSSAILISLVVAISGTAQIWIANRRGKEAKEAVVAAVDTAQQVTDVSAKTAETHSELVLRKLDKLSTMVETNRHIARRDVMEVAEKVDAVSLKVDAVGGGHEALFNMLVDLDAKVTPKVRVPVRVRVGG